MKLNGRHRAPPKHGEELLLRDDGDYVIFQCRCGCTPMDIAKALPSWGVWPIEVAVIEYDGAPALRARVEMAEPGAGQ
jgi:hypothetical protein